MSVVSLCDIKKRTIRPCMASQLKCLVTDLLLLALKELWYTVVQINSNPVEIMVCNTAGTVHVAKVLQSSTFLFSLFNNYHIVSQNT